MFWEHFPPAKRRKYKRVTAANALVGAARPFQRNIAARLMLSLTRPKIGVSETCRAQPSRTVRREKQPRPRKLPEVVSTERRKGLVEDTSLQEWLEALDSLIAREGREAVGALLQKLHQHAEIEGVDLPFSANTPYVNTIPVDAQPPYPGDRELERANKSIIRWNAMAMVVRANRESDGIGGHIKATPRRACTPALSSKAGSPKSNSSTFGTN